MTELLGTSLVKRRAHCTSGNHRIMTLPRRTYWVPTRISAAKAGTFICRAATSFLREAFTIRVTGTAVQVVAGSSFDLNLPEVHLSWRIHNELVSQSMTTGSHSHSVCGAL